MRRINTFVPMETEVNRRFIELVANSSQAAVREAGGTKRAAEEELGHQSSKKQNVGRKTKKIKCLEASSQSRRKTYFRGIINDVLGIGKKGPSGECANFKFQPWINVCKVLYVPPKNNEFEGEIIACSDFRLGTF
nr:hypothetical protein [Tanacetum cinerariifolium]